jgi:hypothetical protein
MIAAKNDRPESGAPSRRPLPETKIFASDLFADPVLASKGA